MNLIIKILLESKQKNNLTVYHGTCKSNAENLLKNGWQPLSGKVGGNMGNNKYLYVSSSFEDALWYAEEKGCNSVLEIKNLPLNYLIPDPEDEAGFTLEELLNSLIINPKLPRKFAVIKPLMNKQFKLL